MNIDSIIEKQKNFALTGQAKKIKFREEQLKKLKFLLKQNEDNLYQAIYQDLKKSQFETYITEFALLYHEIDLALKKVKKWASPKKVSTGLINFPGRSFILPEPYGTTLIIGPWNYPYQLTLAPLIAAVAAGNTSIIKPSELSQNTSSALTHLINKNFAPEYLHVVEGGSEVNQELLSHRFDKIFFTGSTTVGKIVAKAAAEFLTPVTLELGGKNPCFVFADANLRISVRRIIWGKFLNAGQTCVAPDYFLVEKSIYQPFMNEMQRQISQIVENNPLESSDYARIINKKHLTRLQNLIDPEKLFYGGQVNNKYNYMAPTILKNCTFSDEIMKEEIFGPILPVISFSDLKSVLQEVKICPRPLSLYIFSKNTAIQKQILDEVSFGGGCINDVVMHISNSKLPFGGVGESGMGSYHGEAGFNSFSHFKSILKKPFWFESPIKYAPYSKFKLKIIKVLLG